MKADKIYIANKQFDHFPFKIPPWHTGADLFHMFKEVFFLIIGLKVDKQQEEVRHLQKLKVTPQRSQRILRIIAFNLELLHLFKCNKMLRE